MDTEELRKAYADDWKARQDAFVEDLRKLCEKHGIIARIGNISMTPVEVFLNTVRSVNPKHPMTGGS